jgi:hypothetical protein
VYFVHGIVNNQTKKQGNVNDFVYKWGFKEAIVKLTLTKTLITMMMEAKKNPWRLQPKNCSKWGDNWSLKNIEIDIGVIVFCGGGV